MPAPVARITKVCPTCRGAFVRRITYSHAVFCSRRCARRAQFGDPIVRFWGKVRKSETCWLWRGTRSANGYGWFKSNGRMVKAHRFSWTLANGPIPDDMFVCHRCDTPLCVRPEHLFIGTPADNIRDASIKGRLLRGVAHRRATLTPEIVAAIRAQRAEGASYSAIAATLGVGRSAVCHVVNGRVWRHLA